MYTLLIACALEKGTLQRVVGKNFGVAKTTVADIWKDHAVSHLILVLFDKDHFARNYHVALVAVRQTPLCS